MEINMMYPFMTLNDETEIVHSDMQEDGTVKVYIERPDEQYGFKHATCWLPQYKWENIGFIFGQMKIGLLSLFMYILQRGSLLKMQQRYGLLVRGNLCSAIIIQRYLHTRCVIL